MLVVDEDGRILYFNHAVTEILGLEGKAVEGQSVSKHLPQIDWKQLSAFDRKGGQKVVRHEFEISYPSKRFLRLYPDMEPGQAGRLREAMRAYFLMGCLHGVVLLVLVAIVTVLILSDSQR